MVELPGLLTSKGDFSDWAAQPGNDAKLLLEVAAGASDWEPPGEDLSANDDIICETPKLPTIADIPPRQWAYGNLLLLGHASVIGAIDGGGKGAHAVAIALSMITGKPL